MVSKQWARPTNTSPNPLSAAKQNRMADPVQPQCVTSWRYTLERLMSSAAWHRNRALDPRRIPLKMPPVSMTTAGNGRSDSGGIPVPPSRLRAYLKAAGIACIASDGRSVMIARDVARLPRQAIVIYWGTPAVIVAVKKRLTKIGSLDIQAAAAELRVSITAHGVVVQRAQACVNRITAALDVARRDGTLRVFNARYAQLRAQARTQGRGMMSYATAYDRLRRELYRAAGGAKIDRSLIEVALKQEA